MRKLWAALFLLVAAGCDGNSTVVELTLEAGAATPPGIVSIDLALSLAGKNATTTFIKPNNAVITLPTTAALQIGSGLTGDLTIDAIARDSSGGQLDHGHVVVTVVAGRTTQAILTFGTVVTGTDGGTDMASTPAMLAIDNPTHDFGSVITGMMSSPATFTITNNGGMASGNLQATLSGAGASQFTIGMDHCTGMALAGGATCTLQVTYAPTAASAMATLTVTGTPGGSVTSALSGTGLAPGALSVAPTKNDFSPQLLNTSSAGFMFVVTNTGSTPTGVPAVSLTGTDGSQFKIMTNGCTAVLAASGTCNILVQFAPTTVGAKSASLTVTATPGGSVAPPLTGTGLSAAGLTFDSASNAFNTVVVGSSSSSFTFTLSNSGTQTTGAVSTSFTGNTADFQLTDNCNGKTLGAACTYVVTFKPGSYGNKSATITATASPGGTQSVTVTGTGQDSVNLVVSTTGTGNVSGGGINCGNGGATCTVAITRTTSAPSVTLTETPGGGQTFSTWGGDCSGTSSTCGVTMSAARNVTATFAAGGIQPLLHWALDGNGTNTGTVAGYPLGLNGTVTFVTGKFGQAAQFATGAYGVVTGSARAVLGAYGQYTISMWMLASTPNTSNAFLDFENRATAPYGGIQLYYSSTTTFGLCMASTSNAYVPSGSCNVVTPPALNAWHNVILRYNGGGTGAGQGGPVEVYEDDVLTTTINNDAANNPIFNPGESDTLYLGTSGITFDDIRIYNSVFTPAAQCTTVIGGTWTGTSCTLP